MSVTTFDQLPPALALDGSEIAAIYVPSGLPAPLPQWITKRVTTAQIANLLNPDSEGDVAVCSMRQLFAAMAAMNVMVTAFQSLSGDMTNSNNIAWDHAYRMSIIDPFVTGFLQPAIGYNDLQIAALFVLALTFPI